MKKLIKMKALLSFSLLMVMAFVSCQKDAPKNKQPSTYTNLSSAVQTNSTAEHLSSQVATDWYKLQVQMFLHANPATTTALNAEAFAYIGVALYESVRSGIKNSISFSNTLYQMPQMPQKDNNGYDLQVSANATLASLVRRLYPWLTTANKASIDSLENAWNQKLSLSVESEKFKRSQDYGRSVADAIYNWSKTDNYNVSNIGYVLPTGPGIYIPTPLAYAKPIVPFVGNSRPFLIEDGTGVCPPPPFPYSESPSSDFYKMVKDIYDVSKSRTAEQTNMALYWNDLGIGIGYTPAGHVMNVVTQTIEQNNIDLGKAAEAYAKAGIGLRESTITCFRSKYQYLQMRPVSYIRKVIDSTWLPLINTPPHPEYPAAHAFITTTAIIALAGVVGVNTSVVDHTYDFRGFAPHPFASLDKVGEESGNSRRYGGIHYAPSISRGWIEGTALGTKIGNIKLKE